MQFIKRISFFFLLGTVLVLSCTLPASETTTTSTGHEPTDAPTAPSISPNGGNFSEAVSVSISAQAGTTIYYTTDNSTPTVNSQVYDAAFQLDQSTTVRAIAVKDGKTSSISSAVFEINQNGGSQSPNIDRFFWGSWLGIGSEATWYISGNSLLIDGSQTSYSSATSTTISLTNGTLQKSSENLLTYTQTGSTIPFYLFRASGASNSFSAKVDGELASNRSRSLSSLGSIEVIIENLNNPSDTQTVTTEADGTINASETIIGDDYNITIPVQDGIESEIEAQVTPLYDGQDLGVISLIDSGANFKMNVQTDLRLDMLRADGTTEYPITIEITNIGNADLNEAQYTIQTGSGLSISSGLSQDILGTVIAGETKTIQLKVTCSSIATEWEDKEFTITVKDINNTVSWSEVLSLRFLQEELQFVISAFPQNNNLNGLIVDPDGIPTRFDTYGYGRITMNWKPGDWYIIFGGGGTGQETKYGVGFGFDDPAQYTESMGVNFNSLTDASQGEPNNNQENATQLYYQQTETQYLGAKDVDFYTIYFPQSHQVSFDANGATSGAPPNPMANSIGTNVTLPGNTGNLQRTGYTFNGWSRESMNPWNGNPIETVTQQMGDIKLFAAWVPDATEIQYVAAGEIHSMIIKSDGSLWACGQDAQGSFGLGVDTPEESTIPIQIMSGVRSVALDRYSSFILKDDGSLWACGNNYDGQLGDGTKIDRLAPVQIMTEVKEVSAGDGFTLILKTDGTLWSCGKNNSGQLGDGTQIDKTTPVHVLSDVQTVSAGTSHSLAVKTDGTLWTFGSNSDGQLGNGSFSLSTVPINIDTDKDGNPFGNIQSVAAGSRISVAIKTDGTLWAFGNTPTYFNSYIFGGNTVNSPNAYNVPTRVSVDPIQNAEFGSSHLLLLTTGGTMLSSGSNSYGQLGTSYSSTGDPVLREVATGVQAITAGNNHSFYIDSNGDLWGFGNNSDGQLGDGTIDEQRAAVLVYP